MEGCYLQDLLLIILSQTSLSLVAQLKFYLLKVQFPHLHSNLILLFANSFVYFVLCCFIFFLRWKI